MSKTIKIVLIILLILIIGFLALLIYKSLFGDSFEEKIITALLAFLTAIIPLAIKELREVFTEKATKNKDNPNKEIESTDAFDIFVYGHSGSGKTTIIQRLFTFDVSPLETTKVFDYYETIIPLTLNSLSNNEFLKLRIADYKGQDVNQILEAARKNEKINTLLLVADIAPAYNKHDSLTEEQVYELFKKDYESEIQKRLKDHIKYLSEFLLQVVFKDVYNPYLKSVRLIINKIDILEKLKIDKILQSETNIENLAISYFQEIIAHIKSFCIANDITDFEVVTVSATQYKNIKEMFSKLLEKYTKTQRKIENKNGK